MKPQKVTIYVKPETAELLKDAPVKKISERANELMLKGAQKEREEKIRAAYEKYERELDAAPTRKRNKDGISTTMMMSRKLFEDEGSDDGDLF